MGIEYLWGKPVKLETTELVEVQKPRSPIFGVPPKKEEDVKKEPQFRRVVYTMENRKIYKKNL